jgi:hypothetical protein
MTTLALACILQTHKNMQCDLGYMRPDILFPYPLVQKCFPISADPWVYTNSAKYRPTRPWEDEKGSAKDMRCGCRKGFVMTWVNVVEVVKYSRIMINTVFGWV